MRSMIGEYAAQLWRSKDLVEFNEDTEVLEVGTKQWPDSYIVNLGIIIKAFVVYLQKKEQERKELMKKEAQQRKELMKKAIFLEKLSQHPIRVLKCCPLCGSILYPDTGCDLFCMSCLMCIGRVL